MTFILARLARKIAYSITERGVSSATQATGACVAELITMALI
jgi:hypothetical protein